MPLRSQRIRDTWAHFVRPMPRSEDEELLDGASHDTNELAANFRDIKRVNHLLGGTSAVLRHLPVLMESTPADQLVTILDLATGCGDIPLAITRWARKADKRVQVVASDYAEDILALAKEQTAHDPDITVARHDARAVDLPDASFDIVLCSLSLHHFDPEEAVQILREMNRLARCGFILNDLRRSKLGYAAAWIAAHLTTRNRLTRNDAPLSVRRAYTPDELRHLILQAGIDRASISTSLWFRMVAISHGESPNA